MSWGRLILQPQVTMMMVMTVRAGLRSLQELSGRDFVYRSSRKKLLAVTKSSGPFYHPLSTMKAILVLAAVYLKTILHVFDVIPLKNLLLVHFLNFFSHLISFFYLVFAWYHFSFHVSYFYTGVTSSNSANRSSKLKQRRMAKRVAKKSLKVSPKDNCHKDQS